MKEKEAFERWWTLCAGIKDPASKFEDGSYKRANTEMAWLIWKAALEWNGRTQWQPIDTAPKDGSSILAFFPGLGQMVAFYNADGANNAGHWSVGFDYYGCPPTHWKYLCADPV